MGRLYLEGDKAGMRRMASAVKVMNQDILRSGAPRQYIIKNLGQSVRKRIQEGMEAAVRAAAPHPAGPLRLHGVQKTPTALEPRLRGPLG